MTKKNQIYEISILGRVVWNLHSLNNEGTLGNITEPRSVRIIDPNTKEVITTDGISGEMLKHIHCRFLWELIEKKKEKLCEGCRRMEPERSFKDNFVKEKKDFKIASTEAIKKCIICDLHGFLFPEGKITGSRDSLIQFGWVVGKGEVARDIHIHARQVVGERKSEIEKQEGSENQTSKEEMPVQMIYHRPTRSGVYALISVFQPWRIGLNNVSMEYIKGINRKERYELVLKAYQAMFLRTEGAMTTTQLPHTERFEGVIVVSRTNFPVPIITPLKDQYKEELNKINEKLGKIFEMKDFNDLESFVEELNSLKENEPYQIQEFV